MNTDSFSDSERKATLDEFFTALRTAARESEAAVAAAKPALDRLATAITGRDNSQALRIRSLLRSLYAGGGTRSDVSDLLTLDGSLRKDLCAVLLAFNQGEFSYNVLTAAFERAGDSGCTWFLGSDSDPAVQLGDALAFAKSGPLLSTPRTLTERGMAEVLMSLFAGHRVDLSNALISLDHERRALVTQVISAAMAGRFGDTDRRRVVTHFARRSHANRNPHRQV